MASLHESFFNGAGGGEECPCAPKADYTPVPQSFVGNDYFCKSGNPFITKTCSYTYKAVFRVSFLECAFIFPLAMIIMPLCAAK